MKKIIEIFAKYGFTVTACEHNMTHNGVEVIVNLTGTEEKILPYADFLEIKKYLKADTLKVSYSTNGTYKKPIDFSWSYKKGKSHVCTSKCIGGNKHENDTHWGTIRRRLQQL